MQTDAYLDAAFDLIEEQDTFLMTYHDTLNQAAKLIITKYGVPRELFTEFFSARSGKIYTYKHFAHLSVSQIIWHLLTNSACNDNQRTRQLLALVEGNSTLCKFFKPDKKDEFYISDKFQHHILYNSLVNLSDKSMSGFIAIITAVKPMLDSMASNPNSPDTAVYVLWDCEILKNDEIKPEIKFRTNLDEFGTYGIKKMIQKCMRTRKYKKPSRNITRDIFVMCLDIHMFLVVLEKDAEDVEILYTLDNLVDDWYERKYKIKDMHETILNIFIQVFPNASAGYQVEDTQCYNFSMVSYIEKKDDNDLCHTLFDRYQIDCFYIALRHCIIMHYVEDFVEIADMCVCSESENNAEAQDTHFNDQYAIVFYRIWRSLIDLVKRIHDQKGYLFCTNTFNAHISHSTFYEISTSTNKVTQWRYENFNFVDINDIGAQMVIDDTTDYKQICTVSADAQS